jgi:two-component system sensor histidine kinase MtrB
MAARRSLTLGLRSRTLVSFGLIALVTSLLAGVATYSFTYSNLLSQRQSTARAQAFNNAQLMRTYLQNRRTEAGNLISTVKTESDGYAVIQLEPEGFYYSQDPLAFTQANLPDSLIATVLSGTAATQRFSFNGQLYEAVGTPIASMGANYFEAFSLRGTERTLSFILSALLAGLIVATATAITLGWFTSRRLLRPVGRFADAAADIASGQLDARLEPEDDPDLNRLATTFNEMADAVQERIEREIRFASDVSHELRSPVTALTAAIEVLATKKDEFTPRNQQALDIVVTQVRRFDRMVLDLLELSRLESGAEQMRTESVDLVDFIKRVMQRFGFVEVPLRTSEFAHDEVLIDRLRLERIVVNLLANAREHAGGATSLSLSSLAEHIEIVIEDSGPGLPLEERASIFNRFTRGTTAPRGSGSGLGLAIVLEHSKVMGGEVWIEDQPLGGLRFCVRLPLRRPTEVSP